MVPSILYRSLGEALPKGSESAAAIWGLAHMCALRSPDAVRAAKQLLNASALVPLEEGLANEFRASAKLMGSKNQIEAVTARLQSREPEFADPES